MKKTLASSLLFSAIVFAACNSNNDTSGTGTDTSTSVTTNTATGADTNTMNNTTADTMNANRTTASATPLEAADTGFVMKAAKGGMMEVELGNYAQQNAASQRVKDFGGMMVRDHSQANDELKSIVANKSVTLPAAVTGDEKKHMDMLMKKTGKDFDKAYMSMMVEDHKKDINEFEKATKNVMDPDVKAWASKTLPVLRTHLDSAQAVNKAVH